MAGKTQRKEPTNRITLKEPNIVINKKDDHGEIQIYDDIGPDYWGLIGVATIANALKDLGEVKTLKVRINSGGGSVFEGVGIYNLLKTHSAKVTMEIDALAASIASIIAMAGDEIIIAENALMMIHNPMGFTFGDTEDHKKTIDLLSAVKETLVGTYATRSGQSRDDIAGWMDDETWMTAAQAVERGFADKLGENKGVEAKLTPGIYNYRRVPEELAEPNAKSYHQVMAELGAITPNDVRKHEGPDEEEPPAAAAVTNGGDDPPPTPRRNLAARKLDLMKLAG